jgi:hypothetical protein
VDSNGISPDPEKVRCVQEWPDLKSRHDIQTFLGLAGYYRRFVANFSKIAKPLTDLLRDDAPFKWDHEENGIPTSQGSPNARAYLGPSRLYQTIQTDIGRVWHRDRTNTFSRPRSRRSTDCLSISQSHTGRTEISSARPRIPSLHRLFGTMASLPYHPTVRCIYRSLVSTISGHPKTPYRTASTVVSQDLPIHVHHPLQTGPTEQSCRCSLTNDTMRSPVVRFQTQQPVRLSRSGLWLGTYPGWDLSGKWNVSITLSHFWSSIPRVSDISPLARLSCLGHYPLARLSCPPSSVIASQTFPF